MGVARSNTWQQGSQYKCGPHMLQSGTTGVSHYQPHTKGGVILCGWGVGGACMHVYVL